MAEEFRVLRPKEYHTQLLSKGHRAHYDSLLHFRMPQIEVDALRKADSSSLVKVGNTTLVCGCTAEFCTSEVDCRELNDIEMSVELPPICSGPTGPNKFQNAAQLLTRDLKKIVQDSQVFNTKALYSNEGRWCVKAEVRCLNYDGSVIDACLISLIAAIKSLKLQRPGEDTHSSITLQRCPVSLSFAVIGGYLISDPTLEEETIAESTFSITIDAFDGTCIHIDKTGGKSIEPKTLSECICLARKKAELTMKLLKTLDKDDSMDP